jgi:enamine deaminase RidA (YjgF/YER057c/UK114 family)
MKKISLAILFCTLAGPLAGSLRAQQLQRINPDGLQKAPNYTQIVRAGKLLFIAGQLGTTPDGKLVGPGMKEQVDQVLSNLEIAVKSQDGDLSNIAKTTVYVTNIDEFHTPEVLALRLKRFNNKLPTGTLVQVQRLAEPGYKVEIDAIAVLP